MGDLCWLEFPTWNESLASIGITIMKIGVKFCGGCDPVYDRVEYFESIKEAAGDHLGWVSYDSSALEILLVINGCGRACPLKELKIEPGRVLISLTNKALTPEGVRDLILDHTAPVTRFRN